MSAPRILVTCWRRELPTYLGERTLLDTLDPAYCDGIARAGGIALIAPRPPVLAEEWTAAANAALDVADGLLLSGGGDVEPVNYGAEPEDVQDADPSADAWELALLRAARERSLPTLGICRGAQLLAVVHGGALGQSLAASDAHVEDRGALTPEQILAQRHPVTLSPGSRLIEALGAEPLVVNTIHHHRIADAGEMVVTGAAPDGTIEAVEPRSAWACVGVQWHPEKLGGARQQGLFDQLVAAARERADGGAAPAGGPSRRLAA
ncbi:MAG: gamma-glutamyl-gamma-aminobutyrate hydrolase family protein [Solirubrobacteraceae bacterium]